MATRNSTKLPRIRGTTFLVHEVVRPHPDPRICLVRSVAVCRSRAVAEIVANRVGRCEIWPIPPQGARNILCEDKVPFVTQSVTKLAAQAQVSRQDIYRAIQALGRQSVQNEEVAA